MSELTIQIVCRDPDLLRRYLGALQRRGESQHLRPIAWEAEACSDKPLTNAGVLLFDESAAQDPKDDRSLRRMIGLLSSHVPVVVVAAPERQPALEFLISSGAVDFVPKTGAFVPIAADLVERRVELAHQADDKEPQPEEVSGDFGELLRHEVNNPLTGILGNAEMLLARREGLPAAAIERVETIAELAVRLRETVRRLSSGREVRHHQVGS